jgi:DNA-binding response OmpR family regulator
MTTSPPVILLAEDDPAMRALAAEFLTQEGYLVLSAGDGEGALAVWHEHGPVDLLLTDVLMPRKTGTALAEELRELQPGLPVVFMSGCTAGLIPEVSALPAGATLLEKPFGLRNLVDAVRERLEHPARTPRVLLVDDEVAISMPMASYFRRLGCCAEVAGEPEEAAALAVCRRYDVAILDLRLTRWGGGEGLQVIEEIRRSNPGAAIVVLSAYVDEDSEQEARRRGADLILRKPHPLPAVARAAFHLMEGHPVV